MCQVVPYTLGSLGPTLPTGMTGYAMYLSPLTVGVLLMYCLSCSEVYGCPQCHSFLQECTQILSPVCRVVLAWSLVSLSLRVWQFLSPGIALRLLLSLSVGLSIVCVSYPGMPIPRYLPSLKEIKVLHCKTFMKFFKLFNKTGQKLH